MSCGGFLNINIPAEYEAQVSELLARLMMTNESKESNPLETKTDVEVTRVSEHRITKNGVWQFKVHFKGERNGGEWIDDADCDCEKLIHAYLNRFSAQGGRAIMTVYCICRVSSKNQVGPTHVSLEAQEDRLVRTAREKFGINPYVRIKILKISASAYRGIPTILKRVGEAAMPGDAILTYRVDRLSRNIVKFLSFLEELDQRGVLLFAQDENLWYGEKKLEFIQGILDANKEAAIIGKRVKLALERRRQRGDEVFGSVPYGYKIQREEGNRLVRVRNMVEQNVIRRIESDLDRCLSFKQIAHNLNISGIRKRGRHWTSEMVKHTFNASR